MRSLASMVVLVVVAVLVTSCNDAMKRSVMSGKEWHKDVEENATLDGDLDKAEARWRDEIEASRHRDDDDLLTDDPPKPPSTYGKPASPGSPTGGGTDRALREPLPDPYLTDPHKAADSVASAPEGEPSFDGRGKAKLHHEDPTEEDDEPSSEKVGKGAFAALSVAFTLGMMALPYLLM